MDPKTLEIITAITFVIAYALIVLYYKKKAWMIWAGVLAMFLIGAVSFTSAWASINWNVLGIYIGMLFVVQALIDSKMPDYIAIWLVNHSKRVSIAMLLICIATGLLSVVIENVACVLIVAPIIFALAKKLNTSPVPMIIGAAISSNLQGVATLIGDPPSMLLAGYAKLNFNDFFFFQGKPNLFFAVQIGMIASLFVLYFFFRKYDHVVHHEHEVHIKSYFPTIMLVVMIAALAISSSFNSRTGYTLGIISLAAGLVCLIWLLNERRKNEKKLWHAVANMDWSTALFIIGVFIMVDSLTQTGIIADIAKMIYSITGNNSFYAFNFIVWISVLLSAFIDNVPYIVAMLPVVEIVAQNTGASPYLLYFGLLIGASVGGNVTPIGASANIVGVGLLKNRGYDTSFWEFVKIGLPFTIVATIFSAGFIWLMFGI
jgi:Na+/H+ antiporter NhaD/arsenite permease-like protein